MAATTASTADIIAFLAQPASYPHHPPGVEIRQTHASVLALAPPYVFKVKKRVNLGFLDFTTLAARKTNCERERRLNSRLCPDLYLAVLPIALHQGQLIFGAQGRPVDYALQMKLLPEGYFLDQLLQANRLSPAILDQVLAVLQAFYKNHPSQPFMAAYGDIARIRETVKENLATLQQHAGDLVHPASLAAIRHYFQAFLTTHRDLFAKRVQEHKIQDCHGDLHLDHIHFRKGKVCIFDCIEFNDRFRYIDVASDIAFLAMDLDYHDRRDQSLYLSGRITQLLADPDMNLLLNFYKACRACVRAMVECLRSQEPEVPEAERNRSRKAAKRYVGLALTYALWGSGPVVLLVCGPSGSGKSALATRLAALLGWPCLSSDVSRKQSFGLPLHRHPDARLRASLYSQPVTEAVYQSLLNQTLAQVKNHRPVVVDATFGQAQHRALFERALAPLGLPYYFLELQASAEVIKKRLAQRDKSPLAVSDARLEDYDLLRHHYQPPREVAPAHLLQINAAPELEVIVTHLLHGLCRLNSNPAPVKSPQLQ
jgi:uncharacterized protein